MKSEFAAMKMHGEKRQAILFTHAHIEIDNKLHPSKHQLHIHETEPKYSAFMQMKKKSVFINTGYTVKTSRGRQYHLLGDGHLFSTKNLCYTFPNFQPPEIDSLSVQAPYWKTPIIVHSFVETWKLFEEATSEDKLNGMVFATVVVAHEMDFTRNYKGQQFSTRFTCGVAIPFECTCSKQLKWDKKLKELRCDGSSSNYHGSDVPKKLTTGEVKLLLEDSKQCFTAFTKPCGFGESHGATRKSYKSIDFYYKQALSTEMNDMSAKEFAAMKPFTAMKKNKHFVCKFVLRQNPEKKVLEQGFLWMEALKVDDLASGLQILKENRFPWGAYSKVVNFSWNPKIHATTSKAALAQYSVAQAKRNAAWEQKQEHKPKRTRFF